jgi:hypothetical protein
MFVWKKRHQSDADADHETNDDQQQGVGHAHEA